SQRFALAGFPRARRQRDGVGLHLWPDRTRLPADDPPDRDHQLRGRRMGDGGGLRRPPAAFPLRVAVLRRHGRDRRVHAARGLGERARRRAPAGGEGHGRPRAHPRAARRAGDHPRDHLGQLPPRSDAGAVPLRHRPAGIRPDRRLLPELLHHRRDAGGVRGELVFLREDPLGAELRGGGAQPPRRGADGHQSLARHGVLVRRRRCGRRPRRPAGFAEHLGALPDGRAARDPGLHRAGDRRRGAGRRRAARRVAARVRRAVHRALRADPRRVRAGGAAPFPDGVPGLPADGVATGQSLSRWLGAFVVLAGAAFLLGDYHNDVYRKMLLWVTLAIGYNFLFGICGQVSFSHFAFYGIGAYSVVILLFHFHVPLPLAIVLGVAVCVVV